MALTSREESKHLAGALAFNAAVDTPEEQVWEENPNIFIEVKIQVFSNAFSFLRLSIDSSHFSAQCLLLDILVSLPSSRHDRET